MSVEVEVARALPIVVAVVVMVYAIIDCLQTDRGRIASLSRGAWLAIIVVVPIIGPILWLTIAKRRTRPSPPQQRPRPVAPDDDPEFLRQLRDADEKHEQMLRDWESDLRRREDELRPPADGDDDTRP